MKNEKNNVREETDNRYCEHCKKLVNIKRTKKEKKYICYHCGKRILIFLTDKWFEIKE